MDTFELVITLLSFIYALAVAHLLQGVTDLLLARKRVRVSLAHALWALMALLNLFGNWLALFDLRDAAWSTGLIVLQFLMAATLYFTCSLLTPPRSEANGRIDLDAFDREQGWLYKAPYLPLIALVIAVQYAFPQYRDHGGISDLASDAFLIGMAVVIALCMWRRERWLQIAAPALLGAIHVYALAQA